MITTQQLMQADVLELRPRELEVLRLLAQGLTNREIAVKLYVAETTVRTHCKNLYQAMGIATSGQQHKPATRTLALVKAVRLGLLSLDDFQPIQS